MAAGNFLSELKRRNVYRVGVAYAVAAFMLLEVVSNAAPFLDLPLWVGRGLILLLIVGLPAVLCFAWAYEITAEGLKRTAEVGKDASITHHTAHRLNIVIIALIVILAGVYGADRFLPARQATEAGNPAAPQNAPAGISIAVLPFVNLSSDKEQEFFSDGMTEEITSALAKIKGLQVVGRTSAFEFKGQNKDLNAIGKALRANYLLEGSVRKSGNRVRITGQLIRADNGTHIWTENYDRELTDIFATQDDIARAIAAAMRVPLGLGESLVASRTDDMDSYQDFLRAKAVFRTRIGNNQERIVRQTIDAMEALTARDPSFAPAWALLAMTYAGGPSTALVEDLKRRVDLYLPKAEAAGRRAIALDPGNADFHVALAFALQSRGKFLEAEDLYRQALKLDPFNPELLHFYAQALSFEGRIKEAVALRRQLLDLEPLVPNFNDQAASAFLAAGQYEAALAVIKTLPEPRRTDRLVTTYVLMGRTAAAADAVANAPGGYYRPEVAAEATRLLRMPPAVVAPRDLPDMPRLEIVYLHAGDHERFFEPFFGRMESSIGAGYYYPSSAYTWAPGFGFARKTERFKAFVRKAGLVDLWRARGWPDVCHPVGTDDFECS